MECVVGTSGWSLSGPLAVALPGPGTHLERYARHFRGVEITSSFYRAHRPQTYARWARSTPAGFRFAVKLPRSITHEARLAGGEAALDRFLGEVAHLGDRLGPLLVQLPPSLGFEEGLAVGFLSALRRRHAGPVACEPRHPGWFTPAAAALLEGFQVARVAADPAPVAEHAGPAGWPGLAYYRLHGSPQTYVSAYSPAVLDLLAARLADERRPRWCIFDNTARGHAGPDALALARRLEPGPAGA